MRAAVVVLVVAVSSASFAGIRPAALATPKANAALDAAYERWRQKTSFSAHAGAWVKEGDASVSGDDKRGFTVEWSRHGRVGFEYDVTVSVSVDGAVKVVRADAVFSPD